MNNFFLDFEFLAKNVKIKHAFSYKSHPTRDQRQTRYQ